MSEEERRKRSGKSTECGVAWLRCGGVCVSESKKKEREDRPERFERKLGASLSVQSLPEHQKRQRQRHQCQNYHRKQMVTFSEQVLRLRAMHSAIRPADRFAAFDDGGHRMAHASAGGGDDGEHVTRLKQRIGNLDNRQARTLTFERLC
eukprot:3763778-Rhodomonas_salina.2